MLHARLILLVLLSASLAGCADAAQQSAGDPDGAAGGEAQDLAGTRWESLEVIGVDLPAGDVITLDVSTDSQIGASIACNSLGGAVAVEDGRLVTGDLFTTDMGCAPDAHAADAWLADLLGSRPEIALDGDTLTIAGEGSAVVLTRITDGADQGGPSTPSETTDLDEPVSFAEVEVLADEPTMPDEP